MPRPRPLTGLPLGFQLLCGLLLLLTACAGGETGALTVHSAWARPSPQGAPAAAFYMTIDNQSAQQDALQQAHSDACQAVELHRTELDDDHVMHMHPQADLSVDAGQTLLLEPGGLHIMCIDLQQPLLEGEQISLTLEFATAGTVEVVVDVRQDAP